MNERETVLRAPGNPSVERLTTVKVDVETHRLIGDLAHLLGRTRKDVVRDAVNAFAAWREAVLDHGAEASSERLALANARHTARLASGELMTSAAERSERSRVGASRMSEAAFLRLTAHERLELRRPQLERAFAELGARNPRFVDPRDHDRDPATSVIMVDLDDPEQFRVFELVTLAVEIIAELAHVVASNALYPSLVAGWSREHAVRETAAGAVGEDAAALRPE